MSLLFNFTFMEGNQHGQNQKNQRRCHSSGFWGFFDKLEYTFGKYTKNSAWDAARAIRTTSQNAKSECVLGLFSYSGKTVSATVRNVETKEDKCLCRGRQLASSKSLPIPNL